MSNYTSLNLAVSGLLGLIETSNVAHYLNYRHFGQFSPIYPPTRCNSPNIAGHGMHFHSINTKYQYNGSNVYRWQIVIPLAQKCLCPQPKKYPQLDVVLVVHIPMRCLACVHLLSIYQHLYLYMCCWTFITTEDCTRH